MCARSHTSDEGLIAFVQFHESPFAHTVGKIICNVTVTVSSILFFFHSQEFNDNEREP